MKNVLKLVRVAYHFKKSLHKCLEQATDSAEYRLAKFYKDGIERMEDSGVNSADIDALINQAEEDQAKQAVSENIHELLSTTLSFLKALETFVKS